MKVAAIICALVLLCSVTRHAPNLFAPRVMLWAWERPEDLRFLDPAQAGIAYLAATLYITADGRVGLKPRLQALRLAAGASLIQVVRIDTPARYTIPALDSVVAPLAVIANHGNAIQIDFDARASERRFYSEILQSLRKQTSSWIGITALASWCEGDAWLASTPVSEAVPMFFRMGKDAYRDQPVTSALCRASGVSTDEPWPARRNGRFYVFNPHPWTRSAYDEVRRKLGIGQ